MALAILDDEIRGDTKTALSKMQPEYSMTWVYKSQKGEVFPRRSVSKPGDLQDAYVIQGRRYDIKNVVAHDSTVMIEMIESYPDPDTKKIYQTPQVIVLEFKGGKILRGRHYCDPQVSSLDLDSDTLDNLYK